jgi:dihydroorotate dehydrogenase
MLHQPYYNPKVSYEENYLHGPYGILGDNKKIKNQEKPKYNLFGYPVSSLFGIPAGPILNSKFVKGAFNKGFDIVVYKTVRSDIYPCHPNPNIVHVNIRGNLTLARAQKPLVADTLYKEPLSITNSFGVPSKKASFWQKDAKKAIAYTGKGQLLILSFMGTVKPKQTEKQFVDDFAKAAKQSLKTGAKVLEVNLSCPNIGNEGLVCYNLKVTEKVLKSIRKVIGKKPLIVKTGYFQDNKELKKFAKIVNKYAQGISAINTIAAPVVDKNGKQALPGSAIRLKSGICGAAIKWAGIDMVKRLVKLKKKNKYRYIIFGVGGVMNAKDYLDYKKAGADVVMSATGSMWNPYLAQEIKRKI